MKTLMLAAVLGLSVAGCSTTGQLTDSEKLALYRANAGAPVNGFNYFGDLDGWTDLGDSALAVWTRPNQAYLLELGGPCMDLSTAMAIGTTNQMGMVSARFDSVVVYGSPPSFRIPCTIQTIRPLNVKALRASEQELREARIQERAVNAPKQ